jgi:hypothetical protein
MFSDKVGSQIRFEIEQIDRLLNIYEEVLMKCKGDEPSLTEITAAASALHSFYNGLENIFKIITRRIDNRTLSGEQWHKRLLSEMVQNTENRASVISEDLGQKLIKYMGFRHFFRHSYSFSLDREELRMLLLPLDETWNQVKRELGRFMNRID